MFQLLTTFLTKGKLILFLGAGIAALGLVSGLLWYRGEAIQYESENDMLRYNAEVLKSNLKASEQLVKDKTLELKSVNELFHERDEEYRMLESTVTDLVYRLRNLQNEDRTYLDTPIPVDVSNIVQSASE